jgi:hypothetical protein
MPKGTLAPRAPGNKDRRTAPLIKRPRQPQLATEASSQRKRVRASEASDDDNTTTTRKRSSDSESNLPRKCVKQHLPVKNIHFPAENTFGILDCCSDGTLLNFARTSKTYNTIIQPRMIKRALETPYNEDFGENILFWIITNGVVPSSARCSTRMIDFLKSLWRRNTFPWMECFCVQGSR